MDLAVVRVGAGFVMVTGLDEPGVICPVSKAPCESLNVWSVWSLFATVMVAPTFTVNGVGENEKFLMETASPAGDVTPADDPGALATVVAVVPYDGDELEQPASPISAPIADTVRTSRRRCIRRTVTHTGGDD
jgi:hypothetical protein